jgi:aminocarboxymuconate-semialdehyde decarboxylase
MYIRETIRILDELDIPEETRRKVYQDNAAKLLGLSI